MSYLRRASPLHAARAGAGGAYCLVLAALAIAFGSPVVLGTLAVAALGAAAGAGVGREVAGSVRWALPLALLIALVNVLVDRNGLTVFARLGDVPPFGQIDLTVEALVYGLVLGLRVAVVGLCCALLACAVDPDEVLRGLRRLSFRSALTAALALRLVPVLMADGRRRADALRCRADAGAGGRGARLLALRATATGALDRAIDVAATLEVRGYGARRAWRGPRARAPWSRHDIAFAAAALMLLALGVWALAAGAGAFDAYPRLHARAGAREAVLCAALVLVALAPFADRRGIER
ncbi:MAG TPA: CbiQ family ECF transporter T component [Solirubrobacteraceae bacterium]|nr:CbiQ family ECF transporter T component [Solirubrobacteraceae bacterium]